MCPFDLFCVFFLCLNFIPDQWVTLAWLCLWPNPCHFQAFPRSTPDTHWEKRKYLGSSTTLQIADVFLTLACVTFQLFTFGGGGEGRIVNNHPVCVEHSKQCAYFQTSQDILADHLISGQSAPLSSQMLESSTSVPPLCFYTFTSTHCRLNTEHNSCLGRSPRI